MADEISLTASLTVNKPSVMTNAISRAVSALLATMTGNFFSQDTISVGITATLIPVGQVTQPHWSFFHNLDSSNYLAIRNGASGADVIQLYPGEVMFGPLLVTGTFYAIANTAPCLLEYLVLML